MQKIYPQTAPPCVRCNHPYVVHKRPEVPVDVAVYVPCMVCHCSGYTDNDPWADDPDDLT